MTETREGYITMSKVDSLKLAIKVLERAAETLVVASRMVINMPEFAPPESKRDFRQRNEYLASISTLKQMVYELESTNAY